MTLALGSLCSGVDGLALGVERALGARTVWQAEIDPHASIVLAVRWPGVPNLGDLRAVDWAGVEPVDLMSFGFPCQDISSAGRRAGLEGDRSALWFDCAGAVRVVRPRYVLVENVGALIVRGLGTVVGDLAAMGYVGRWGCLRSSDVGAPHRRERVFIAAADTHRAALGFHSGSTSRQEERAGRRRSHHADRSWGSRTTATDTDGTPRSPGDAERRYSAAPNVRGGTPRPGGRCGAVADSNGLGCPGTVAGPLGDGGRSGARAEPPHVRRVATDADGERFTFWPERDGDPATPAEGHDQLDELDADGRVRWGVYEHAIRRWEAIHGPAPTPRDERGRLNPEMPEWMLGFPPGWVTDPELGLPRTAQLRLLGNSVQPQVAELAARLLLVPLLDREMVA